MDQPQRHKRPADLLTSSVDGESQRPQRPSDLIGPRRLTNRDYRLVMSMVDDVVSGKRKEVGFKVDGHGVLIETSTGKKIT